MPDDAVRPARAMAFAYGTGVVILIAGMTFLFRVLSPVERPPFSTDIVYVDEPEIVPATPADLGSRPKTASATVRLGFVGDVMQHRGQAGGDFMASYAAVRTLVGAFDLAVGNLEFPVDPTRPVGPEVRSVRFNGSPAHLDGLAAAGFDLMSTANNHAFDQGLQGVEATLQGLAKRGIAAVGTGTTGSGNTLAIRQVGGLRIGFAAYTFRPNSYRGDDERTEWWPKEWQIHEVNFLDWTAEYRREGMATFAAHVDEAERQGVDLLIALVHWGEEWHFQPTEDQRRAARDLIDAGFGLVVGGHSHVLNPPEVYRGRLIAYSLGNFVSDFVDLETRTGAVLEVEVARTGDDSARVVDFRYYATLTRRDDHVVLPLAGGGGSGEERHAWTLASRILGSALVPYDASEGTSTAP